MQKPELLVSRPMDKYFNVDQQCPVEGCETWFKIVGSGWQDQAFLFCPSCGHKDESYMFKPLEMRQEDKRLYQPEILDKVLEGVGTLKGPEKPDHRVFEPQPPMKNRYICYKCDAHFEMDVKPDYCPICGKNPKIER